MRRPAKSTKSVFRSSLLSKMKTPKPKSGGITLRGDVHVSKRDM